MCCGHDVKAAASQRYALPPSKAKKMSAEEREAFEAERAKNETEREKNLRETVEAEAKEADARARGYSDLADLPVPTKQGAYYGNPVTQQPKEDIAESKELVPELSAKEKKNARLAKLRA